MTISKHSKNKSLFLQLLQAARGKQQQKHQSLLRVERKDGRQSNKYLQLIEKTIMKSTAAYTQNKLINELPCFPLYPEHIRIISQHEHSSSVKNANDSQSNNQNDSQHKKKQAQVSPSSQEFHRHLCKSIQSAKKRVKLATLYIGAG